MQFSLKARARVMNRSRSYGSVGLVQFSDLTSESKIRNERLPFLACKYFIRTRTLYGYLFHIDYIITKRNAEILLFITRKDIWRYKYKTVSWLLLYTYKIDVILKSYGSCDVNGSFKCFLNYIYKKKTNERKQLLFNVFSFNSIFRVSLYIVLRVRNLWHRKPYNVS